MPKTTTKAPTQIQQEKEVLQSEPEVSLFISCLVMVNQLRGLERAFKGGEFNLSAFLDKSNAVLSQLTETVSATERFDIVLPVMDYGQFSPFFWRWFNWWDDYFKGLSPRSEEHTSELQSHVNLVCRLLLEKKKMKA